MKRNVSFDTIVVVALVLYAWSVWAHFPYAGGHIYSDIVTVFQIRECGAACVPPFPIPYVQSFIEYPIGTAFFAYAMGVFASFLPGQFLNTYYLLSCFFLSIPTLLLIRELRLITTLRGLKVSNIFWFLVATPTFLFALLANWYVIGACFTVAGLRFFTQGRTKTSGLLLGLSAATNLVTAVPALGLLLSARRIRDAVAFAGVAVGSYLMLNLPIYLLNPANWLGFWRFQYNWYIEDSWMLLFVGNESPLRHVIPEVLFAAFILVLLVLRFRFKTADPLVLSFICTFAFVFSTYVYTPQMNVLLLPFFVVIPALASYPEFIVFDALNALVIVGFSTGLTDFFALFGVALTVGQWGLTSPIQLAGIIRSFWVGKFAAYDGLYRKGVREKGENKNMRDRPPVKTSRLPTEKDSRESYSSASSLEAGASAIPPEAEDPSTT
ncbi:MAG TPA: hypothetical protein VLY21_04610 [Nitrososphaerales archaeon]|nr:hypothetical protein [Nitrososphaerales archaeon]